MIQVLFTYISLHTWQPACHNLFQTDSPLVHVLYDKVNELTCTFLRKFLKPDVMDGKEGADLSAVDFEKEEVGSGTKCVLAASKRSIVALRVVKEAVRVFGSCTAVPVSKVRRAHSEYALFLENERKQALVEEAKRKKEEEELEAMRAEPEDQQMFARAVS